MNRKFFLPSTNSGGRPFPSGSTRDAAGSLGIALNGYGPAEAGMGVVVTDLDQDRRVDLFVTHLFQETNTLYLGATGGRFADATLGSGLGKQSADRTGPTTSEWRDRASSPKTADSWATDVSRNLLAMPSTCDWT